eukprot:11828897-Alexandrium_andersonii.AAC.1
MRPSTTSRCRCSTTTCPEQTTSATLQHRPGLAHASLPSLGWAPGAGGPVASRAAGLLASPALIPGHC